MKLCQKCFDGIKAAIFSRPGSESEYFTGWQNPEWRHSVDAIMLAIIWKDKPDGKETPEPECQFWAHKALEGSEIMAQNNVDDMVEHIPVSTVWKIEARESKLMLWQFPQINPAPCIYTWMSFVKKP